jgi:hypothetical protein
MSDDMNERVKRVHQLFMRKLAAEDPHHPWILKERSMKWQEPRVVDQWYWMDIEAYADGALLRVGRVSWPKDGGLYDVSITYESEHGLCFPCWPSFHALSDAQDFVERLMAMPSHEARALNGTQWPGVVLWLLTGDSERCTLPFVNLCKV